ncbi:MAG: 4Fe-4S dicluster domain-containing protein [Deltaproteobacteria bacterium]|nr:4Fe-4S dicluster domain-containing protein [Deltaproteobacteria bacterium]
MGVDRRKFLKIAGMSTLGLAAKPAADVLAKEEMDFTISEKVLHFFAKPLGFQPGEALTAKRWAMVVKVKALDEEIAEACQEVCHKFHNVPEIENPKHEIKWIWHDDYEHTLTDQEHEHIMEDLKNAPFLVMCNHCYEPPCVRVCPTQATFKRETDGIVLMDMHRCIGCRFCMAACPYGSRSFNWVDPRKFINEEEQNMEYPTRMKGVVEKCNFCAERLAKGKMPYCVETAQKLCAEKGKEPALIFGDLEDPDSEVRKVLRSRYSVRRKPALGTHPNVYYIV